MSWNNLVRLAVVPAAAALLAVAGGCGSGAPASGPQVTMIDASWAEQYSDVGSLSRASDVAIVGTVTGVAGTNVRGGVPFTDFRVRIVRVLRDPQGRVAPSRTIVVHQTGGPVAANHFLEVHDDLLFRPGETMALFLREFAPGQFRVLAGPGGRFEVSGNSVSPTHHGTALAADVRTVDHLASEVARA
jgi:hypothetical protein